MFVIHWVISPYMSSFVIVGCFCWGGGALGPQLGVQPTKRPVVKCASFDLETPITGPGKKRLGTVDRSGLMFLKSGERTRFEIH